MNFCDTTLTAEVGESSADDGGAGGWGHAFGRAQGESEGGTTIAVAIGGMGGAVADVAVGGNKDRGQDP